MFVGVEIDLEKEIKDPTEMNRREAWKEALCRFWSDSPWSRYWMPQISRPLLPPAELFAAPFSLVSKGSLKAHNIFTQFIIASTVTRTHITRAICYGGVSILSFVLYDVRSTARLTNSERPRHFNYMVQLRGDRPKKGSKIRSLVIYL